MLMMMIRSASICDIRPVANSSGEFYATVRKSGKVPEVPLREPRPDRQYFMIMIMMMIMMMIMTGNTTPRTGGAPTSPPQVSRELRYLTTN